MISIHGKINETQVESSEEVQIIFTLNDNSLHKYLYKDNKIFFIITEQGIDKKYITLCENIDSCTFSYTGNKLKTTITIGEIIYNNNFNI